MERPTRILISEDTDQWQQIFKRFLSKENYEVRSATNLQDTKWQLERCSFELVLVDISLDEHDDSNTDGFETMRLISNLPEDGTEAIVLTGNATVDTVDMAVEALREYKVFNFLRKQKVNENEFLTNVRAAVSLAKITSTKLALSKDPLSYFADINIDHASSALGIKRDRLQFFLKHLVRKTSPIAPRQKNAQIIGTGEKSTIVFDYWSKAFACGAHLEVGSEKIVTIPNEDTNMASLDEAGFVGIVEARKNKAFEDYIV